MPSPPEQEALPKPNSCPGQTYPPSMGYPGYYPNPYQQQIPYAQAPPGSYYGSSYPDQQFYQRPASSSGFLRGIFTGLIVIVVLLCISTTITWLILRPRIPFFALNNFSVSNFNVTEPVFSAQWTANLTIENQNTKLKGYFDRIQGLIYHPNVIGEDDILATAFFQPVFVDIKKSVEIEETFRAGEKEQEKVPSWVAEEMKKEKETGTVTFNMRMVIWVTFKTDGGWSARERGLKVFCKNLKVVFEGGSRNGAVLLSKPLACSVYVS